jgi:hypothetical protein
MKLIPITLFISLCLVAGLSDRDRDMIEPTRTIPKIVIPTHKWSFVMNHDEKYPDMPYEVKK